MKFDMSIDDNYASFIDKESGEAVFVESFDNVDFEVRIGTVTDSQEAGIIRAKTSDELNTKLEEVFRKFRSK